MPYQNDMNTLADVVAPSYAAQQMGIQDQIANQKGQQENEVYQAQMPALEQEPGLKNLFTQAQTAQTGNLAQGDLLNNIQKAGTLGSSIQAGNAENQLKLSGSQVGKLQNLGQMAGQIAGIMDNVPPPARQSAMQEILTNAGVTPQQQQQLGPILSGDPDLLRHVSQAMIQSSPSFQQASAIEGQRAKAQTDVAGIQSNAKQQVAETNAQARIQVEQMAASVKRQLATVDQTVAGLAEKISQGQASPQEQAVYQELKQHQVQLRDYQAQTTRALLGMGDYSSVYGGGNTPTPGGTGQPAPTAQAAAAPAPSDVEAEMKRRGLLK